MKRAFVRLKIITGCTFFFAVSFFFSNGQNVSAGPFSCGENPDSTSTFLVIVAEKMSIDVEPTLFDSATYLPYAKFTAHYRVLERICGDYYKDTITFTVYDHYGFPAFGYYQHVLLYLDVTKHGIFHEMYLYSDLYKTKEGKWASPYSVLDHERLDENERSKIKPEKIDFTDEVSYSTEGFTRARTNQVFPEPYYKIDKTRKRAIAVFGNYVPELFEIQKETVLNARRFFGHYEPIEIEDVQLKKFRPRKKIVVSKKDSTKLLQTWTSLVQAIKANDTALVKALSYDSVICSVCEGMPRTYYENNLESIDMFIDSSSVNFQKADLWPIIDQKKFRINVTNDPYRIPNDIPLKRGRRLTVFDINFSKILKTSDARYGQTHSFGFVKIDKKFRFFKMESN